MAATGITFTMYPVTDLARAVASNHEVHQSNPR
jgi:hypothetical protein